MPQLKSLLDAPNTSREYETIYILRGNASNDVVADVNTRVKLGGGHGGHNGLRSLLEQLGTPDFARIRVGIGRPPVRGGEVASWVLGGFAPELTQAVGQSVKDAAAAVAMTVKSGPAAAMNQFNSGKSSK